MDREPDGDNMRIGSLVTDRWGHTIGVVHQLHDEYRDDIGLIYEVAWEILWINSSPPMQYTVEDEEDLEVLCE